MFTKALTQNMSLCTILTLEYKPFMKQTKNKKLCFRYFFSLYWKFIFILQTCRSDCRRI